MFFPNKDQKYFFIKKCRLFSKKTFEILFPKKNRELFFKRIPRFFILKKYIWTYFSEKKHQNCVYLKKSTFFLEKSETFFLNFYFWKKHRNFSKITSSIKKLVWN
jgi:hypothetical protein